MKKYEILENLYRRYPELKEINNSISEVADELIKTFAAGKTLFLAGNGGSACDAEHLAGELLKGFCSKRPLDAAVQQKFTAAYGEEGTQIAQSLQRGLKCISLLSHPGYNSAFANDVDNSLAYAQQLQVLGCKDDAVIGFSTSGNAENIRKLFMTARMLNIKTILFSGQNHGKAAEYADLAIHVPETETYKIQELHLPLYHALALIVETHFFNAR